MALVLLALSACSFAPAEECPVVECEECIECAPCDPIVINSTTIEYVDVEVEKDWLGLALDEFLSEVEDDLDKYQEISKVETEDEYTIAFDLDRKDNQIVTVTFEVSYRVTDTLKDERDDFDVGVEVVFREDRDPKVSVI
jgi:hypothetical protein